MSKPIPWDTVVSRFNKLAKVSGELVLTVTDGIKTEGLRVYVRKHLDVFTPIIDFLVHYLVWLKMRS